jgi:hypothetical protein
MRRSAKVVAVAAAVAVVATASGLRVSSAGSAQASLPRSMVGGWHRTIGVDLRKPGAPAIPSGTYHLTIQASGAVRLLDAQRLTYPGSLAVVSNGVVIKVDICQNGFAAKSKNLYRWKVVGTKLTFRLVRDSECSDRVAVFKGTWLKG